MIILLVLIIILAVIAGIVGLIWLIKKMRKGHKADLKGPALCPECKVDLVESDSWVRRGLRGEFFRCSKCGQSSWWDFSVFPPKISQ